MGTRVYVGRVSHSARERDIERFFKGYGRIRDVMLKNGYCFVVSFLSSLIRLECMLRIRFDSLRGRVKDSLNSITINYFSAVSQSSINHLIIYSNRVGMT